MKVPQLKPGRWLTAALVLLTVALVVPFGAEYRRKQAALAGLEQLGAVVSHQSTGPAWLRNCLGGRPVPFFVQTPLVSLRETEASDATLEHLRALSGIERLSLHGTAVTDAGAARLKDLSGLKALDLSHTQVTDAGLASLKSLKNLEYLYLSGTAVTRAGLAHLHDLDSLVDLALDETAVTDDDLQPLRQALPRVRIVR